MIFLFKVSKKNLKGIVEKLMVFMDKTESTVYKDEVLVKIIDICSRNDYHFIICFEWYSLLLLWIKRGVSSN